MVTELHKIIFILAKISLNKPYRAMKLLITFTLVLYSIASSAQDRQNPVIAPFGGIYDISEATVKADPDLQYKIVIDVATGNDDPSEFNWALNNVARLMNLHAVSGADVSKMEVVLAIHGGATYSIADNETYKTKYDVDNPNLDLIDVLSNAGVKLTVCGQSLKSRGIEIKNVNKKVEVATSMLTTVTTHQLKGFAFLKF